MIKQKIEPRKPVIDLDGPDGNVFALWGILEQFWNAYGWEGDPVEESKTTISTSERYFLFL